MKHVITIAAALTLLSCATPPQDGPSMGVDPAELSKTIRPQDDFFGYVNQNWIDENPIPQEYSSYGVSLQLFERTEEQVKTLIEAASQNAGSPDAQRIGDLYNAFMDEQAIEAAGLDGLAPALAAIEAVDSYEALWRLFGELQSTPVNNPVVFYTDADAADPDTVRLYMWQSGLGLPDRDYYLENSDKLVQARADYAEHIAKLFALAEWEDGALLAPLILALETRIAEQHWTNVRNRDRQRIYTNKFTIEEANALSEGLDWAEFLDAANIPAQDLVILAQDSYFKALPHLMRMHSIDAWKAYLKLHTLKAYAPYLSQDFVEENFDFQGRRLRGQEALRDRWKRGISFVNRSAGELLGKVYVEKYFPESSKAKISELVENLRAAFADSIQTLAWMSPSTKEEALTKLAAFTAKLGYPDEWRDYGGLETTPDSLIANVMAANRFNYDHEIAKLSAPTDRSEWGMSPQTVNAYYRPTFNEIVFPAAILQPPFFDPNADDALNYGAIGAIIGHEFSHGFDDQGRKFDGTGRLRDWWQPEDAEAYEGIADRLVGQYNAFQPLPDTSINGRLTLGENIADLAGLTVAHKAYRASLGSEPAPVINGFSGDQRFFLGYALSWRGHMREQRLREILLTDPHSPGRYRVQGVVRNMPAFHEAFDVQDGDGMYLPPEQRVRVW